MRRFLQHHKSILIFFLSDIYILSILIRIISPFPFLLKWDALFSLIPILCAVCIIILGHIPSQEFLVRREKLLRLRNEKQMREEYCVWLNTQTNEFVRILETRNFRATWGFQFIQSEVSGEVCGPLCVFNLPVLEIVALDENSYQMLYCKYTGLSYGSYLKGDRIIDYQYTLIPFSQAGLADVEYEDYTIPKERTVREFTPWHGMAWTSDGLTPISGGTVKYHKERDDEFVGDKIVLSIETGDTDEDKIEITVRTHSEWVRRWDGTKYQNIQKDKYLIKDARCGIVGRNLPFIKFQDMEYERKCGTVMDCTFSYSLYADKERGITDEIDKNVDLRYLRECAKHINGIPCKDAIVPSCDQEDASSLKINETNDRYDLTEGTMGVPAGGSDSAGTSNNESDDSTITVELQMDTTNKAHTIIELAKLKREGLITKDEFDKLKNELMEQDS